MKPRFLHAGYLVWMIGPFAAFGMYQLCGLPHAIWSYSYRGGETGFASRHYTRCTFIGPYGEFTTWPHGGHCGWLLFRKQAQTDGGVQ